MTKQAERPLTASFQDDSSCTFDSNDFVKFEILTGDLPMGEIVFKGSPFTDAGLTELGRCVFDYCDHGLYVYQELANMLYEAQHPWLDYADAVEKGAFAKNDLQSRYIILRLTEDNKLVEFIGKGWEIENLLFSKTKAFKPVKPFDFYHFNQVKVWQPLETVL
jgi:hypothetical protein